ncbi:MAG: xanthine dehydrogenase family protein molybdopterin-binding subunit [Alphaproteobacteria bacterium]|jgi:2-furoyl-CoA dehydrogenase large subunit|nr:xanthine dehydrogenase family protein molybdopterin-binding subunit [Alphaproteobacteria bacterium]
MAEAGGHRWISRKRRTKEDGRFITGRATYVADVRLPDMRHVALVTSPYPSARIVGIDAEAALALPGVDAVLTGAELAAATNPLANPLDTPGVQCYPLADGVTRYVGEWVAAVVAESRHLAEDAAELIEVDYEPLPYVIDPEEALEPTSPVVHAAHGSNVLYRRTFVWGPVETDFESQPHRLAFRARWGRSATVPIETFGVVARWDAGEALLDVWASIQMPSYPEQIAAAMRLAANNVRVHYEVDVGGSYGVKRGIKHTVLVGYLARKLGRPVRFIEDRLENMSGGDMHGPDRIFDVALAFDDAGVIKSMKLRALDDVGAHTGRAPLQLGKPVGAIVGPYRIASVEYEAISVATNKTGQIAVRGFGQSPTNFAIEAAVDQVARRLGLDRAEVRRRNFIRSCEFPYRIPSGSEYDSGDYHAVLEKALDLAPMAEFEARRESIRSAGRLAGIGIAACLEPGGGNSAFEPLLNPKNPTTTWPESCLVKVDRSGNVTVGITTSTSGQGHQTLAATIVGEELSIDPDLIRVVHLDSLVGLPGNSPVASRMAIMLGGAAAGAARIIRERALRIAAHVLARPAETLALADGQIRSRDEPEVSLPWAEVAEIAHRRYHDMPPGLEPGLQATYVWEVPKGGTLPTEDGRVQMYPCYSFAAHVCLVEIEPLTGQVKILDYALAHDCGTIINPDIVKGMVLGGVAHGIGAALYEIFAYDAEGQLLAGSLMDYVMPSAAEVPEIKLAEHCTPSPLTSHGQKGVGEGGYLGAPAAIANAVNDALAPHGLALWELPLRATDIADLLAAAAETAEGSG